MASNKSRSGTVPTLLAIRHDVETLLSRIDSLLTTMGHDRQGHRSQSVLQTYPEGYDFRGDMAGLQQAIGALRDRVAQVDQLEEYTERGLFMEIKLRTAEARLFQSQCQEGSSEWETTVNVIRTLTRIVSEERPGFVYGLAAGHNTDWGLMIQEVREDPSFLPLPLSY